MTTAPVALERITTQYIDSEDRIRLAGVSAGAGAPVVIWLTQRLLQRLLPVLFEWLERQGAHLPQAEVFQGFAQQAAQAALTPQAPVSADVAGHTWLALAVDVHSTRAAVSLSFRGAEGTSATLTLPVTPLRQWLGIIHVAYRTAQWPTQEWPEWIRLSADPAQQRPALLH